MYEDIKKRLNNLAQRKKMLKILQKQIAELTEQIAVSSIDYSRIVVKGGVGTTQQEQYINTLEKMQAIFSKHLDAILADELLIAESTNKLSPVEHSMVIEHYINKKSWRKIEQEYNYSERQCRRMLENALKKIIK